MRYTNEHLEYVRQISPGRYNCEIVELFNQKFGTNVAEGQMKAYKSRHKIKSNVPRSRVTEDGGLFSKEQKDFIRQNAKGLLNQELADLVNEKFNLSVTAKQIKTWKQNRGVSSGLNTQFKKGHQAWNKGLKGLQIGGKETQFKKGQTAWNHKPIGYERIDKEGYVLIKVQEEGPWHKRWRHKHKVVWEKENGQIPSGYKVLFADGNKQNISLGNLILVSNRQLLTLNRNNLIRNNADLTRTGIMIADLYNKIKDTEKEVSQE